MYKLYYKEIEISVRFEQSNHYYEYLKNGVLTRILVKSPTVNDSIKQITINSDRIVVDNNGTQVSTPIQNKIHFDSAEFYNKWYNYSTNSTGGKFWFAPSFNGFLSKEFQDDYFYCFNPFNNFEFFQPVVFECSVTENTITVDVINGTGTFEYSLDGNLWQDSNVFVDLDSDTSYTVFCRTKEDLWVSKKSYYTLKPETTDNLSNETTDNNTTENNTVPNIDI